MKVFGMVTTINSWEYTSYALKSFFRTTRLDPEDRVILIDNDKSFDDDPSWFNAKLEKITNQQEKSFAANFNAVLEIASQSKADLYFLNNDIIYTEDWILPLLIDEKAILSPLSNREIQYEIGGFKWDNVLKLSDYIGREPLLKEVVKLHKANQQGYKKVISLPFFCVKIPAAVYQAIGSMDESFGKGGAEDNDYCLRAILGGFDIKYAMQSFVLHFSGKSTWAGGETKEATDERCAKFRAVFKEKWGNALSHLIIDNNAAVLTESPELSKLANQGDLKAVIEALKTKAD